VRTFHLLPHVLHKTNVVIGSSALRVCTYTSWQHSDCSSSTVVVAEAAAATAVVVVVVVMLMTVAVAPAVVY